MKTMLNISEEFINSKGPQMFDDIWQVVKKELMSTWKSVSKKSEKQISEIKMTELYTLLTISGSFIRTNQSEFGLTANFSYEESTSMKLKIGELEKIGE